ncbi:MAG: hypothetical protein OXH73_13105 [Caldilineaceae bacterium]|nr:hypothetical protein [Caldilineaceae bacterium]
MTSEVAVMNTQAIALAADSAVTFGDGIGQKIFTSASKIFTLSKYQPVGIMVYGNANFMGVPWETIIKIYRKRLEQKTFKTVGEYAEDFLSFLRKEEAFSETEQDRYIHRSIYGYFGHIEESLSLAVKKTLEEDGKIDEATVGELVTQVIQSHFDLWNEAEAASSIPEGFAEDFKEKYGDLIRQAEETVFEKLPLSSDSSRKLVEIAANLFMKFPKGMIIGGITGVVIAGFGREDVFPVLESFSVEGRIDGYLKQKRDEEKCAQITLPEQASIVPFAQSEMVYTFIAGVDFEYQALTDGYVEQIYLTYPRILVDKIDGLSRKEKGDLKDRLTDVGKEEFDQYLKEFAEYRTENRINPIMKVVRALPKDELAAMAESLISLTSFKRRVSMEAETVAGPIDVAVISKGDGFIWIKRKHYFESGLNQHYFANYYREELRDA